MAQGARHGKGKHVRGHVAGQERKNERKKKLHAPCSVEKVRPPLLSPSFPLPPPSPSPVLSFIRPDATSPQHAHTSRPFRPPIATPAASASSARAAVLFIAEKCCRRAAVSARQRTAARIRRPSRGSRRQLPSDARPAHRFATPAAPRRRRPPPRLPPWPLLLWCASRCPSAPPRGACGITALCARVPEAAVPGVVRLQLSAGVGCGLRAAPRRMLTSPSSRN